jgi:TnpA family transposase
MSVICSGIPLFLAHQNVKSAYVIDGLMHNDVIKSDIHSTDTHGYSEAIFATTHLLGFSMRHDIKN